MGLIYIKKAFYRNRKVIYVNEEEKIIGYIVNNGEEEFKLEVVMRDNYLKLRTIHGRFISKDKRFYYDVKRDFDRHLYSVKEELNKIISKCCFESVEKMHGVIVYYGKYCGENIILTIWRSFRYIELQKRKFDAVIKLDNENLIERLKTI